MSTDSTKALTLSIMLIVSLGAVAAAPASAVGTVSTTDDVDRGIAASQGVEPTETDSEPAIPTSFDATVESGYFQVGSGDQNDQDRFEFTECPDGEGEECIEISGNVDEDGSFYAAPGDVNFPPITVEDTTVGDIDAYIETPDGLEGELTPEGDMTLGGDLFVDLRELSDGCGITASFDATTGESGDLSGSPIQVSDDGETGQATLVDNEFEVPTSEGCGILSGAVDDELDVPSPSGENQLVMNVAFEFDYAEAEQGTVTGIVTDEAGEPVSGATVSTDATNDEVRTGADGSYELSLDEGDYTVEATAAGYDTATSSARVSGGATTMADLTLAHDGETDYRIVASPAAGEVGDTVTTEVRVVPVSDDAGEVDEIGTILEYDRDVLSFEGASGGDWDAVELQHDDGTVTATADETGLFGSGIDAPFTAFTAEFELIGDPGAETTLGFDEESSAFSGDHGGFLGIGEPGLAYGDAVVSIDPAATLEGTVTDADGEPVEGATVAVGDQELTTGEDGAYATELQPGEYDVNVSHEEYEDRSQSVQLEPGDAATVDVALGTPTGVVEGTVTDADGEPVEGATVAAGDQQTTTDADGAYDLELDVGEYDLEASAADFESDSATVTVEDSTTTTQDLSLEAEEPDPNGGAAPDEFDAETWADWLEGDAISMLENEYYTKVPGEINAQAQEILEEDIVDPVSSPEDMRAEADWIEDNLGDVQDDAEEAYGALRDAADAIEDFREMLTGAADDLRSADDPESEAERINEDVIASINADVAESNERLENVDSIQELDEIDTEGEPAEPSDPPADENDEEDEEEDSDAMGATTQSFGVVVALLAIVLAVFAGGRSLVDANLLKKKSI